MGKKKIIGNISDSSPKLKQKSEKSVEGTKLGKKKVPKQLKMDRFITKKTIKKAEGSPKNSSSSRRSTTLKAKNYSELESDTESLFEVPNAIIAKKNKTATASSSVKGKPKK